MAGKTVKPDRRIGNSGYRTPPVDPTPEEIAECAAEIRAEWKGNERIRRDRAARYRWDGWRWKCGG